MVTPSHNPPGDGGFKYNPPHGGPADSDATTVIAARANELIRGNIEGVRRVAFARARAAVGDYDFLGTYVDDLPSVLDLDAIREAGVRIGADPLGGASVGYWGEIADRHRLDLTVVNPLVDPTWRFMTLDWDGKIRMDCSSPYAMASLIGKRTDYDLATGNDADADRHGIVTPDAGLMNPNHFLAVAIGYLFGGARPDWPATARIGKTLVSSSMIDRVAASIGKPLVEVPVGFKWFVPGLMDGSFGFGGEESAGASFLRRDGSTWTTDKDGIVLALLASEILGATGRTPSQHYADLVAAHGDPAYARIDAPADREQKAKLGALSPDDVTATTLAGEDDHRQADRGAGQRRQDRRAQGDHRVGLVRRAPQRDRGRLQDLRRVVPWTASTWPRCRPRRGRSSVRPCSEEVVLAALLGRDGHGAGRDGSAPTTRVRARPGAHQVVVLHLAARELDRDHGVEPDEELCPVAVVEDGTQPVAAEDATGEPGPLHEDPHLGARVLGAPQQRPHAEHRARHLGHAVTPHRYE